MAPSTKVSSSSVPEVVQASAVKVPPISQALPRALDLLSPGAYHHLLLCRFSRLAIWRRYVSRTRAVGGPRGGATSLCHRSRKTHYSQLEGTEFCRICAPGTDRVGSSHTYCQVVRRFSSPDVSPTTLCIYILLVPWLTNHIKLGVTE